MNSPNKQSSVSSTNSNNNNNNNNMCEQCSSVPARIYCVDCGKSLCSDGPIESCDSTSSSTCNKKIHKKIELKRHIQVSISEREKYQIKSENDKIDTFDDSDIIDKINQMVVNGTSSFKARKTPQSQIRSHSLGISSLMSVRKNPSALLSPNSQNFSRPQSSQFSRTEMKSNNNVADQSNLRLLNQKLTSITPLTNQRCLINSNNSSPNSTSNICQNCENNSTTFDCSDCQMSLCSECSELLHKPKKLSSHIIQKISITNNLIHSNSKEQP